MNRKYVVRVIDYTNPHKAIDERIDKDAKYDTFFDAMDAVEREAERLRQYEIGNYLRSGSRKPATIEVTPGLIKTDSLKVVKYTGNSATTLYAVMPELVFA